MTTTTSSVTNRNFGQTLRSGTLATAGAMAVNGLLFTLGNLPPEFVPFGAVMGMTFMGGLTAIIGYLILTRFLAQKTAVRVMWVGVALVLLGFAYNPFTIPNASVATILILQLMHLVAALPAIRLTRKSV